MTDEYVRCPVCKYRAADYQEFGPDESGVVMFGTPHCTRVVTETGTTEIYYHAGLV